MTENREQKRFLTCSGRRSQERLRRAKINGTSFFLRVEVYVPIHTRGETRRNKERQRIVQKINDGLKHLRNHVESENGIMKTYNDI